MKKCSTNSTSTVKMDDLLLQKPTKPKSDYRYLRFGLQLRVFLLAALNLTTCYFAKEFGHTQWTLITNGKIQQLTNIFRENLFYKTTRKPVLILTLPSSPTSVTSLELSTYLLLFVTLCLNFEAYTGLFSRVFRLKSARSFEKTVGVFILPVLILTMCALVEEFIDSATNFRYVARVMETFDSGLLMFMNVFLCCVKFFLWLGAVEVYEKTTRGYLPFIG